MRAKTNRGVGLIGRRLYRHTSLVRTIERERLHVMQLQAFGKPKSLEKEAAWERAAYASEDQFLSHFNGRVG
ncbi:hypothetical protein ABT389_23410 [Streptomyces bacillaris]|uniref:Uncharacterized protein n=2 Tax=Streptomyces TaxID=1883 RepID=A0A1E7M1P5_9ACTN|nr:hypothetical protein [Streptomyces nanshensis]OEV22357.1 hypothetical protein AN221_01480 [Streptomyces nanshensis]